jgi:DNA polymerase I-like protein with 3'-5' exonuclease and polymerase domains/uracil-DNA glycosylase
MNYDYYKENRTQTTEPSGSPRISNPGVGRSTYVPSIGNLETAKYVLIGAQPHTQDVLRGRALSCHAGQELEKCLHSAGININDCYFTYVVKDLDRPLAYYIEPQYRNKTITGYSIKEEGQKYVDSLATELTNCTATTIISLGDLPLFILADRISSLKWRSSVISPTLVMGKNLIPTLDMESLANQFTYKNKRLVIWDLKRATLVASGKWACKYRNIILKPSFGQAMQFLEACRQYGILDHVIFFDIEMDVFNHEMTCISFAYTPEEVISIPFTGPNGDYFTPTQERDILLKIAKILEDPDISIGGQNLCFDCHYMLRRYGIKSSNLHDTMVAQKTLLPDYPVGLDFICSLYTDLPYYKEDGKYWLKGIGTFETGWRYNALDSVVCAEALPKQLEMLEDQQNYYTYKRKTRSMLPYIYMMEHGIKINVKSMQNAYILCREEAESILIELETLAGQPLNPSSPKQIATYFYDKKNLPAYKSKTGGRSTDEKALKRIARKGYDEAKLILQYRKLIKESSTYLNPDKVDKDGRMRCSYNPVGTRFARASSSESIFGTGNNLQNQPHEVLTHFEADNNYVFYGLDLSQAENRIVAYVGRISQMIEAFESGKDIHGLTAQRMILILYGSEKSKLISIKDPAPIGDGTKCWRDWGKKANHGLNYDLGYKNFSLHNEIPERDGKTIVNGYHKIYPGVRDGFHSYIKQCINKNRTLTNLLGRKTLFTDVIGDSLFKGAYSCIPQGTVGDIIDQRGLNFVYYNRSPLFRHVQLLIQVHDQIGFQVPTPYHTETPVSWDDHHLIVRKVRNSLETPLKTHYGKKFVIPVDISMGISLNKNLGIQLKSLDPQVLSQSYNKLKEQANGS